MCTCVEMETHWFIGGIPAQSAQCNLFGKVLTVLNEITGYRTEPEKLQCKYTAQKIWEELRDWIFTLFAFSFKLSNV